MLEKIKKNIGNNIRIDCNCVVLSNYFGWRFAETDECHQLDFAKQLHFDFGDWYVAVPDYRKCGSFRWLGYRIYRGTVRCLDSQ